MEFLLLWIDDLDDAIGALRHLAPRILGFVVALGLFAATGIALLIAPHIVFAIMILALSVSLIEVARRRLRASAAREQG
ncbi:MAG TPA: hypothetical protein VKB34_10995 [Povalibacter sp.]|nr:hypothetical protein [Povalibacter sp.]